MRAAVRGCQDQFTGFLQPTTHQRRGRATETLEVFAFEARFLQPNPTRQENALVQELRVLFCFFCIGWILCKSRQTMQTGFLSALYCARRSQDTERTRGEVEEI